VAAAQGGRARVFAQGALKKRLCTRAQAEECLAIAKKLKKRGKVLAIENIFVRKGYLSRTEAASIAKRLKKKGAQPALALVEEDPKVTECPNCARAPGSGPDCFRCGADLVTGGPGPRATSCGSCGKIVLKGTALCPGCARPVARPGLRSSTQSGGGRVVGRLITLGTLAGMGYFIHHHATATPAPIEAPTDAQSREVHPALGQARVALRRGARGEALKALEQALEEDLAPPIRRDVLRAIAEVAPPKRALEAARLALKESEEPALRLVLARLALQEGKHSAASDELEKIPAALRGADAWRLIAAVEKDAGRDWLEAMLHVEALTPAERRSVALGLMERGRGHQKNQRTREALRDLRRARKVDGSLAAAHFALGLYLLELEQDDQALTALRAAVQADPAAAVPYLALGMVLERQGKTSAAVASYREFVRQAKGQSGHEARVAHATRRLEALGE
jgi:tetratricopeptide (TPR) repeat protein